MSVPVPRSLWILVAAGLALGAPRVATATPGTFARAPFPAVEDAVTDLAVGNLRAGDSRDVYLVLGNTVGAGGIETAVRDRVFFGFGGEFVSAAAWTVDSAMAHPGAAVALADIDGDGLIDAVVAGGATNGVVAPTLVHFNPAGVARPALTLESAVSSTAIAAADYDGDLDSDLAIARENGTVDVYRNEGAPGPGLVHVQTLIVSDVRAGALAFGAFDATPGLDLVLLRPQRGAAGASPGVQRYVYVGGAAPFADGGFTDPLAQEDGIADVIYSDLAAGALDGDAFDDVVVAASTPGASRILRGTASGFTADAFRFPVEPHTAVAIGDLDGADHADIVLARPATQGGTISVWLAGSGDFTHNAQCGGRHAGGPRAIAIARIDPDVHPDLFVAGARDASPDGDGTGWWRNDAALGTQLCCVVEAAASFGEAEAAAKLGDSIAAAASIDVPAYAAVRDVLMAEARSGPRLRNRFATHSPEIVLMMIADGTLRADAAAVIGAWSAPVRALVDGRGAEEIVTGAMLDAVDAFLARLSAEGSDALAQAIAEERGALPPFTTFVGLDLDAFRATVLPGDALYADGFE